MGVGGLRLGGGVYLSRSVTLRSLAAALSA